MGTSIEGQQQAIKSFQKIYIQSILPSLSSTKNIMIKPKHDSSLGRYSSASNSSFTRVASRANFNQVFDEVSQISSDSDSMLENIFIEEIKVKTSLLKQYDAQLDKFEEKIKLISRKIVKINNMAIQRYEQHQVSRNTEKETKLKKDLALK
ncbi:hypothetical protein SS50377_26603 [Spironucleus salmonicida]|uniref:Uncharacterized protein n=1 Tax=Spironucleus salmonicida TaxID=348837 RepID=V6LLA1_9EUKA|nr:hypothetical protein SS50377_26603 [Spironucleus salmonicida]|eukprot:EST41454.1 Hypothetical protein SS50377_19173 [Spironucleus salmonicida]